VRNAPRFFLIDAFAARPFSGEPLLLLLDDESRPQVALAALAGEFRGTTVVALRAPRDSVNSARLEFFSPSDDRQGSLGALVAAATLLAQRRAPEILARESVVVSLEAGESLHRCEVIRNRSGVCYAEFALTPGGAAETEIDGARFAAVLGLGVEALGFERHHPRRIGAGLLVAPLASRAALARATLSPEFSQSFGAATVLAYVRAEPGEEIAVEARLIGQGGALAANGPAIAAFAAAAVEAERPEDGDHEIFFDLLDDVQRRARLTLRLSVLGGELETTRCGGQAVVVASGEFDA